MTDEDAIRTLLDERTEALKRRDAVFANAMLDARIVAFEVAGPLQVRSMEATDNAVTQSWLDSFDEGPNVTLQELAIHVDGSVAFCHSLNRLRGRHTEGQEIDMTMRSTLGLRRFDGEWRIIHGHTSLPR